MTSPKKLNREHQDMILQRYFIKEIKSRDKKIESLKIMLNSAENRIFSLKEELKENKKTFFNKIYGD